MTPEEAMQRDDPFESWLAECDELLAAGATPVLPDAHLLTPELRRRLEESLAGLRLLHQWKPRGFTFADTARPAGPAAAAQLPWATLGRFQLRRELGRGGFGMVFLAYDPHLAREVALKVPYPEQAVDPAMRERFRREAQAASRLEHPNLVPVYEVGEEGPVCFIVSAYCPGVTLAQWLKARADPVPFREAARLAAALAGAVAYAHRQGVIHRDLKPANILLQKSEIRNPKSETPTISDFGFRISDFQPKITDFGLAKQFAVGDATAPAGDPTRSGAVMGTPSYMAPEQARGKRQEIGPGADVYALGAILYELVVGRPPFRGESDIDTLLQVQSEEVVPPARLRPRLARDLETICLKCLHKERKGRYASAEDLAEDLHRFLRGEPVRARRIGPAGLAWRWCRRQPVTAALVSAVATLLVVVAVGATLAYARERGLSTTAQNARADEKKERLQAQALLERQYVDRAARLLDQGDVPSSLPWIVEGLRLATDNPEREAMHRYRLGAALRYMPRPEHVWLHDGPVTAAEFSPDGSRVVTASQDGTARVWNTVSGEPVTPPLRHKGAVNYARISPDGQYVITVGAEPYAQVWNAATGEPVTPPLSHDGQGATQASFSPDSQRVVIAAGDGSTTVWDVATGTVAMELVGHTAGVRHAAFSPNGARIVTASRDNTARLWDATTGKQLAILQHDGMVFHADFSRNSRLVVTAAYPYAQVWDAETGRRIGKPLDHVTNVFFAAFSPDGQTVATASADNSVRMWETKSGRPLMPRFNHPDMVNTVQVKAVRMGGDLWVVVSACDDGTVRLWDLATHTPLPWYPHHAGPVRSAWLSPDCTRLLTAGADGTARLWNLTPADLPIFGHAGIVFDGSFSPDGSKVATASWDRTVELWDVVTGKRIPIKPMRHDGEVRRVCFSADGHTLLTASLDGTARVWNADAGECLWVLQHDRGDPVQEAWLSREEDRILTVTKAGKVRLWDVATRRELARPALNALLVNAADWSPDGTKIVTGGPDNKARLWDAASGDLVRELEHSAKVLLVTFSRDGTRLLTAGEDTALVWETATGRQITSALKHGGRITQLSFSPDGECVLTAGTNSAARVWRVATGQPTGAMKHQARIETAAFSTDGRWVATASIDGTARVWDAATGEPITAPLFHGDCVWHVAFSPDGRYLLSTSGDKMARLWELPLETRPLDELVKMAQVLTGLEMREAGHWVPLDAERFRSDWMALHERFPRQFPCLRADEAPVGDAKAP
jgi:WD40 repeat protein/serine/threonine protein kinase